VREQAGVVGFGVGFVELRADVGAYLYGHFL
jgi:hypothetical protein